MNKNKPAKSLSTPTTPKIVRILGTRRIEHSGTSWIRFMEPSARLIAKAEPLEPSVGSTTNWSGNSHSRIRVYSFCPDSALSIIIYRKSNSVEKQNLTFSSVCLYFHFLVQSNSCCFVTWTEIANFLEWDLLKAVVCVCVCVWVLFSNCNENFGRNLIFQPIYWNFAGRLCPRQGFSDLYVAPIYCLLFLVWFYIKMW